jgi:predicted nucleotidyltransferase
LPAGTRVVGMSTPDRVLRPAAILRVLADHKAEFVVVGGVAVQAHGYLRGTGDIDIVPRPTLLNLSRLGEALVELEATPRHTRAAIDVSDPHLLKRVPMIPLTTSHGRLDLLSIEQLAGAPASYDELDGRALTIELEGFDVRVAGLDDLLRMKRAAGRDQDRLDIAALTRTDDELEAEAREAT